MLCAWNTGTYKGSAWLTLLNILDKKFDIKGALVSENSYID